MDISKIINMIINTVMRRLLNTAVNKGVDFAANKMKPKDQLTDAEREQGREGQELTKRVKQGRKLF